MLGRSKLEKLILKIARLIYEMLPEKDKSFARNDICNITQKLNQKSAYYSISLIEDNKAFIHKTLDDLEQLAFEAEKVDSSQKKRLENLANALKLLHCAKRSFSGQGAIIKKLDRIITVSLLQSTSPEDEKAIFSVIETSLKSYQFIEVTHWERKTDLSNSDLKELFGDTETCSVLEKWAEDEEELSEADGWEDPWTFFTESPELSGYPQDTGYVMKSDEPNTRSSSTKRMKKLLEEKFTDVLETKQMTFYKYNSQANHHKTTHLQPALFYHLRPSGKKQNEDKQSYQLKRRYSL